MPAEKPQTIEAVIVSYQSAELARALIEAWGSSLDVCLVDNANGADGLSSVQADYINVRYIPLPGVGYARAANAALGSSNAEIIVYANPDSGATIDDIRSLCAGLAYDKGAICHAAMEEVSIGRYYSGGWLPSPRRCFVHSFGLHRFLPAAGIVATSTKRKPPRVEWVAGSLAAYRRGDLLAAGGFDERFFLYTEDMALGHVALRMGLRSVVRSDVLIHPCPRGNGTPAYHMTRVQGASLAHYLAEYGSRGAALASRSFLVVGFIGRSLVAILTGKTLLARAHYNFVLGILTGRSFVDGKEVSAARIQELLDTTATQARPGQTRRRVQRGPHRKLGPRVFAQGQATGTGERKCPRP